MENGTASFVPPCLTQEEANISRSCKQPTLPKDQKRPWIPIQVSCLGYGSQGPQEAVRDGRLCQEQAKWQSLLFGSYTCVYCKSLGRKHTYVSIYINIICIIFQVFRDKHQRAERSFHLQFIRKGRKIYIWKYLMSFIAEWSETLLSPSLAPQSPSLRAFTGNVWCKAIR